MIPSWKYPVVMVALAILWKFALFTGDLHRGKLDNYSIFVPVILLGVAIFLTIRKVKKSGASENRVFRQGLTGGVVFSLFFAGFLFVYYSYIDPAYFPDKLSERLSTLAINGATEQELTEDYIGAKSMAFNPIRHSVYSMFGLMFLSFIFSAILTFINRSKPAR